MIKELFDLGKEENLIIENRVENREDGKYIFGRLIQSDCKCPKCNKKTLLKNGTYVVKIKLGRINMSKFNLSLIKQKYKCSNCNYCFTPYTKLVDKYKQISNIVYMNITIDMIEHSDTSQKGMAIRQFVSPNTVGRNLEKFKGYKIINKMTLPEVLCVDEFRGIPSYNNKMNFIMVDGDEHKIKDILLTRRKNDLDRYFYSYPLQSRECVKYFVTDFWQSYISLAKKYFPTAKIIIDRFHIKRLILNTLKNKAIQVRKRYKKYHEAYKIMYRYRNLLYKSFEEISIDYKKCLKKTLMSEYDILIYILEQDVELYEMYWTYQEFLSAFDNKDVDSFIKFVEKENRNINHEMKNAIDTFKNKLEYCINSLIYPYSNGVIEGINTKIKLIIRTAYGFRNFENLRIRIFLAFGVIELKEIKLYLTKDTA